MTILLKSCITFMLWNTQHLTMAKIEHELGWHVYMHREWKSLGKGKVLSSSMSWISWNLNLKNIQIKRIFLCSFNYMFYYNTHFKVKIAQLIASVHNYFIVCIFDSPLLLSFLFIVLTKIRYTMFLYTLDLNYDR